MRYVDLMGGAEAAPAGQDRQQPRRRNRASHYAPSTKFYLQDKRDGKPWITRLPFPVHVVERVETYDHISRNRFVTRYAYHHGYFDGEEREFRGFGMVEQWDTEEFAALDRDGDAARGDQHRRRLARAAGATRRPGSTPASTSAAITSPTSSPGCSNATDQGEYFREPGLTDAAGAGAAAADTVLPDRPDRSTKSAKPAARSRARCCARRSTRSTARAQGARIPTPSPSRTSPSARCSRGAATATPCSSPIRARRISYHYERNPADPRIQHALTLEVDDFGNVLQEAADRLRPPAADRRVVRRRRRSRRADHAAAHLHREPRHQRDRRSARRLPHPAAVRGAHLRADRLRAHRAGRPLPGLGLRRARPAAHGRLRHEFTAPEIRLRGRRHRQRVPPRPIEHVRTLYRRDDLTGLLPLGRAASRSRLPGESYKLAFTPGLLAQVFQRPRPGQPPKPLLPDPAAVLGGRAAIGAATCEPDAQGRRPLPRERRDDHWWIPSGRSFFSPNAADTPRRNSRSARQHFFLPRRYRDPVRPATPFVDFDAYDLLMVETRDALGNRVTVDANDYRVLQPRLVSDPNRNRTEVAFDTLGMVVGTAVMGKPLPAPRRRLARPASSPT